MFAAITAAGSSPRPPRILLIEHNFMLGRKLLKTGNGRCNITNRDLSASNYHGDNCGFLNNLFPLFGNSDLLRYFEDLGVEFKEEDNGCVFPVTDQASTILDVLKEDLDRRGVKALLSARAEKVSRNGKEFRVSCKGDRLFTAPRLVLATGGLSYPQLGASGDGYRFAEALGHSVNPPLPALAPLNITDKSLFDLQGVRVTASVEARRGKRPVASATGEMLFTHYGVSGPVVLHLSNFIARDLSLEKTFLRVNFFPGLSREKAAEKLLELWRRNPKRSLGNSLMGILPKKLPQVLMRNAGGLDISARSESATKSARGRIVNLLTALDIEVKSTTGFKDAQVTSGGVPTREISGATMESRRVKNLYLAGELLDVNGDCGGYNLQFAFSSGYCAGKNAAGSS